MKKTLIQHIEVTESGGRAAIEFTVIPQTYTDLYLVVSGRSDRSAAGERLKIQLNSDSSSSRSLEGSGSNVISSTYTSNDIGILPSASATANTFGSSGIYICNYTSTTNKSVSSDSVNENNATYGEQHIYAYLATSTTAVTSLTLTTQLSNNFVQYSSATLYGITAGNDGITTVS